MARVVEDSDDEFPDLADLIKNVKAAPTATATSRKLAPGTTSRDIVQDDAPGSRSTSKAVPRVRKIPLGKDGIDKEEGVLAKEVARPRKRVLNQKNDNPLLQPLSSAPTSRASSGGSDRSYRVKPKEENSKEFKRGTSKRDQITGASVQNALEEESPPSETKPTKDKESKKPASRDKQNPSPGLAEDEDDDYGSDGLSDFIVDSTFLDEESVAKVPSPRSVRRLIKGRKPVNKLESDDEDLDLKMGKLTVKDDPFAGSRDVSWEKHLKEFADSYEEDKNPPPFKLPEKFSKNQSKKDQAPAGKATTSGSDTENPFTLKFSPPNPKSLKVPKETRFKTPPGSPEPESQPKPRTLASPKKPPRIPATPHRPSMDAFWQQDVINNWNEEYSPHKPPAAQPKLVPSDSNTNILFSPKKSPSKQEDKAAKEAKKAFAERKHALAESFLKELDAAITNTQVSSLAASTGGIKILWSKKLNTTAGRANWKRETLHPKSSSSATTSTGPIYRHHAAIELAEKVIDDEHRLLNVLAHEYCHLANFMVSGIKTNPHGKEFKAWAAKTSKLFGHRGVEVTTKHSYEIDYRYVWTCVNAGCGQEFKRHSKSIDPKRHQCGVCKGRLVQTKPVPRGTATSDISETGNGQGGEKELSEYQLFVKENMRRVKEENPGSPQKEIMGRVGKRYQELKASRLGGGAGAGGSHAEESKSTRIDEEDVLSMERTPDEEGLGGVVRKLDFLDLTGSP